MYPTISPRALDLSSYFLNRNNIIHYPKSKTFGVNSTFHHLLFVLLIDVSEKCYLRIFIRSYAARSLAAVSYAANRFWTPFDYVSHDLQGRCVWFACANSPKQKTVVNDRISRIKDAWQRSLLHTLRRNIQFHGGRTGTVWIKLAQIQNTDRLRLNRNKSFYYTGSWVGATDVHAVIKRHWMIKSIFHYFHIELNKRNIRLIYHSWSYTCLALKYVSENIFLDILLVNPTLAFYDD